MRILTLSLVLWFSAACTSPEASPSARAVLSGRWELVEMEYRDSSSMWKPYLGGMHGELLYHPHGFMSLHLTPVNYPKPNTNFTNFDSSQTEEQLQHLAMFYSYTGNFRLLNDSVVEHERRIHSNPREWGSRGKRIFHLRGDSLFMRPAEEGLKHIRLTWIKSAADL